jgi:hypothetical protein
LALFGNAAAAARVGAATGGISYVAGTGCNPASVHIDTTYTQFYKIAVDSADASAHTEDFLSAKLISSDSSIGIAVSGNQLDLTAVVTTDPKVKVNSSDATSGYLADKIPSSTGDWGLAILVTPSVGNDQLLITPKMTDPSLFASNFLDYISTDSDLVAKWCALQSQCAECLCTAPGALSVSISDNTYVMLWTVGGSPVAQTATYRQRGNVDWISNVNISPANVLSNTATTATVSGLCANTVYQFQVNSICSGISNYGNIYESIIYTCQTLSANVVAGVITVTQPAVPTVDTIQYTLYHSTTPVETVSATGANPVAHFASVAAGTYTVKWRYGTVINGTTLYSDDASQLNAMCTSGSIVVS